MKLGASPAQPGASIPFDEDRMTADICNIPAIADRTEADASGAFVLSALNLILGLLGLAALGSLRLTRP